MDPTLGRVVVTFATFFLFTAAFAAALTVVFVVGEWVAASLARRGAFAGHGDPPARGGDSEWPARPVAKPRRRPRPRRERETVSAA